MKKILLCCYIFVFAANFLHAQTIKINDKSYQSTWDVYLTEEKNSPKSIVLDFGLYPIAPYKDCSNLITVSVKMNSPREDGLSSQKENDALYTIEDKLIERLSAVSKFIYVGRVTHNNYRTFYYYANQPINAPKLTAELATLFASYNITVNSTTDTHWNLYKNLYPTPLQFEKIQNTKVVQNLVNNGDNLSKPRDVFHWIYFQTDAQRARYISDIEKLNFTIVEKTEDKENKDFPFILFIKRKDKVDLESVNTYAIQLYEIAVANGGKYDGWETSIEK